MGSTRRLELESSRSCLNVHHLVSKNRITHIVFPKALVLGSGGAEYGRVPGRTYTDLEESNNLYRIQAASADAAASLSME